MSMSMSSTLSFRKKKKKFTKIGIVQQRERESKEERDETLLSMIGRSERPHKNIPKTLLIDKGIDRLTDIYILSPFPCGFGLNII